MARAYGVNNLDLYYQTTFEINICGCHIYKSISTPKSNNILKAKHDPRKEELEFDEHAIGVYNSKETFVGQQNLRYYYIMFCTLMKKIF